MPEKMTVDIELLMPKQLEKDLMEHQQICKTCNGLGIIIRDNKYGLKEEPWIREFPYKNQSLFPCPDCYNGVQPVCKYCGAPGSRRYVRAEANCRCQGATNARNEKRLKKDTETWEKAEKISIKQAIEQFSLVYIDGPDEYISPENLIERLAELKEDDPETSIPYIWGTDTTTLSLPAAGDLVSNACEELYEGAEANIAEDKINRLQEFLDQWVAEVKSGTTTYWPDYKIAIIVE